MANQLFFDLYACDKNVLDDMERIKEIAHNVITKIGAGIVEECMHKFEPIGVTYIAVITTSHFSVHTWPEYGYAAVDIFSCDDSVPNVIGQYIAEAFGAKKHISREFDRDIEGRKLEWNSQ